MLDKAGLWKMICFCYLHSVPGNMIWKNIFLLFLKKTVFLQLIRTGYGNNNRQLLRINNRKNKIEAN